MHRLGSPRICSNPRLSSDSGSVFAVDRSMRAAEVISLDAARAVFRPQASERWKGQAEIVEDARERALGEFLILQHEPLLQFRDFSAGL
jgi:hypothetical protein